MRMKIAATALVVPFIIAGCSSGSSSSSTTSAAPATSSASPTASSPSPTSASPTSVGTIVDVAAANPDFSTLVAAVKAAGLVDTLSAPGPYTVFAPTNAAFAALPAGLLDKLLLPKNKEALTKILTYHVVAGKVMAADVKPGAVKSVEGSTLTITTTGGVKVDDALVTATDVEASNGVIHVIDAVLVPDDVDVTAL